MSTTVTYKGNTLTTVDNQTRTLKTAGKYLEDDITLVDTSSTSIYTDVVEILPNGGEHHIITTDISLANDTVTASTLLEGVTAHDASGNAITGTLTGSDLICQPLTITTENTWSSGISTNWWGWNESTHRFSTLNRPLLPNSSYIFSLMPSYNTLYISATLYGSLEFKNLSSGVTVLNNGEPIIISSTASHYAIRIIGSRTSARSFTIAPKSTEGE